VPRKRNNIRLLAASFFAVFIGLFIVVGYLYYISSSVPSYHLPETIPHYTTVWSKYAPEGILQLTYRNLTSLNQINSSALNVVALFELNSPHISISSSYVDTLMTIVFSRPNATVELAFLKNNSSFIFDAFKQIEPSRIQGDASLYFTQALSNKSLVKGWAMTIPRERLFAFSEGSSNAYDALSKILQTRNGTISSVLANIDLRKMFYIVGGPNGHLAFTFQNFPGLIRTGNMTLQVVDADTNNAKTYYVVGFVNSDYAMSQLNYFKKQYFTSQFFRVYDNFLLALKLQPLSQVASAFRDVG
jgi:hypothetical protein